MFVIRPSVRRVVAIPSLYDQMFREMEQLERAFAPVMADVFPSLIAAPETSTEEKRETHLVGKNKFNEIINDEKRVAFNIDVRNFKPEELKVEMDGNRVTVCGTQEHKNEEGNFSARSFTRSWTLPKSVDKETLHSSLTEDGLLIIEAAKKIPETQEAKTIPIQSVPKETPAVENTAQ